MIIKHFNALIDYYHIDVHFLRPYVIRVVLCVINPMETLPKKALIFIPIPIGFFLQITNGEDNERKFIFTFIQLKPRLIPIVHICICCKDKYCNFNGM